VRWWSRPGPAFGGRWPCFGPYRESNKCSTHPSYSTLR